MATQIPAELRAVVLTEHCMPAEYKLGTLPVPQITRPDELLIKTHAAGLNPIDVMMAGPIGKVVTKIHFPHKIGNDIAGTVIAIGTAVTKFKVGDEVYSCLDEDHRGSVAEYAVSDEKTTALKPKSLDFDHAAAMPLAALTALQALDLANEKLPGGLRGKTVYIPGGLSGTGHFAVQLAKNVFGAGKVITTLSTRKIPQIKEFLGEAAPDQIIDYTKENVNKAIGKGTVDFMFDTQRTMLSSLSVMKKGSIIVSISMTSSGKEFKKNISPVAPFYVVLAMNLAYWALTTLTGWMGITYKYLFMVSKGEDLDRLSGWVAEGKLKPLVGRVAKLENIEDVKAGCQQLFDGKGGVGKFVIEIV